MDNQSSDEEELKVKSIRSSGIFHRNNNKFSIEDENTNQIRKRSSSMSLNLPKDFVPKLKPIQTIICPSPINLNQKFPPSNPSNNENIKNENLSVNPQKNLNLKPIKFVYYRKRKKKRSTRIMNIEEETHETEAISDCEDKSKKIYIKCSDSDSSKSEEEKEENDETKIKRNNNKIDIMKNIKFIREKMISIKKNSLYNENIFDDSNIGNNYVNKRFHQYKNIYQQNFINKFKRNKNKILNPLKPIKYRTKSFNIKQRYVSTILGFLEKNNSSNSLNSNGK